MISPTLEKLSALVFADPAFAQTLQAITDQQQFDAALIARAAEQGIELTAADIQAQCNQHARQWLERWL
jgi:hypothetical protein